MEHKPSCTQAERSTIIHIYAYTNLRNSSPFRYNILTLGTNSVEQNISSEVKRCSATLQILFFFMVMEC